MAKPTTNFIDKHVGMRVRRVRMFREISQAHLAYSLSISLHQLQKYEGGFQRIDAVKLLEICRIFQVRPAFFFDDLRLNGPLKETCIGKENDAQEVRKNGRPSAPITAPIKLAFSRAEGGS